MQRTSLAYDAYHLLRSASWGKILLLFAGVFAISNVAFAAIYHFGPATITNATGFLDCLWFSVQTMGTIGYGYLAPSDHFANAVVTIETFYSIILTALITGTFFSRFSTPSARVVFSKVAIIAPHDGQPALQFRMANERTTAIVEANVRLYLVREERLSSGETMRRVYDLPLRRTTSPVFILSFLAVHTIDTASPLYGLTAADLRTSDLNLVVTFTGIDDQLATTVHARYVWGPADIVFDHKFVDLFQSDPHTGARYVDLGPIHDTTPMPRPITSEGPSPG